MPDNDASHNSRSLTEGFNPNWYISPRVDTVANLIRQHSHSMSAGRLAELIDALYTDKAALDDD